MRQLKRKMKRRNQDTTFFLSRYSPFNNKYLGSSFTIGQISSLAECYGFCVDGGTIFINLYNIETPEEAISVLSHEYLHKAIYEVYGGHPESVVESLEKDT